MKFQEDNLQKQVARYLDLLGVLWFHPANERKTSKISGKRLKSKGVKSGVPDCVILEPKKGYHGLFIELKVIYSNGRKSSILETQKKWLNRLEENNYKTAIVYNFDQAMKIIDDYLK